MFTSILGILLVVVSVAAGFGVAMWWNGSQRSEKREILKESTVLLERIEKVFKVVLAEGHFSEIYDYEDQKEYFLGIKGPSKKALIVAKAKVMVGFDFAKARFRWEGGSRRMVVEQLPPPEVLSIDSDYNIYDIDQGLFNKFDKKEYNQLLTDAKQTIHNKAIASELPNVANRQMLLMVNQLAGSMGWSVDFSLPPAEQKALPQ